MSQCTQCAAEIKEGMTYCPKCGQMCSAVQVLTPQERENFQGITIQDDKDEQASGYEQRSFESGQRVYVRHIQFGSSGFIVKLILLVITLLFIFVFLPMAMMFAAAGILGWFIIRLLKR